AVPLVPILAIAFCLMLMAYLAATTWIAFGIWLAIGLVIYFGYARQHSRLNVRGDEDLVPAEAGE
ncbi:MAG: amino acid permease C-terminal domain-containing protein, partial [Ancalomicrobiaceae bacterium]|nr:amino acid permease C-terminal domain-containing protein [Ancalomicrobiaceae bacterium]